MPKPPEIDAEDVEAFAQAARQKIDARLQTHAGECPKFWILVAKLYVRQPMNKSSTVSGSEQ